MAENSSILDQIKVELTGDERIELLLLIDQEIQKLTFDSDVLYFKFWSGKRFKEQRMSIINSKIVKLTVLRVKIIKS